MISHSSLASPSYLDYDENKVRQGGEKYAIKAQRYYDQYLERIDVNNAEKLRKLLIKSALKGKYEAQSHLAFLVKNADELAGWTLIAARHNAESKEADVIRKFCPNSLHPSCSLRRAHKKWKRSLNKIMSNQEKFDEMKKIGLRFRSFLVQLSLIAHIDVFSRKTFLEGSQQFDNFT